MKILEYDIKTKKMQYREMFPEEITEQEEDIVPQPTPEERIEALEMAMLELAEVLANG